MKTKVSSNHRFLSLLWKTIIAVSIATLTASAGIVFFGKLTLENNYSKERIRTQRFFQQALDSALERSKQQEFNIAWLIPAFIDSGIDSSQALQQINKLISDNWFKIEVKSDIQSTLLFSTDKTLVNRWGNQHSDVDIFQPWLDFVIKSEQPLDRIICSNICIHYFATPFLHRGNFIGVFIFGIDLSDVVLQMKSATGAGIGMMINQEAENSESNRIPLQEWSKELVSLTDFNQNKTLLDALIRQHPEFPEKSISLINLDQQFEFSFLPLKNSDNQATLFIIDDISQERKELRDAQSLYLINGLISLFLSGGILLIVFIKPMRRIKILISVLPLIAKKQFSNAEKTFPTYPQKIFKDEIDILGEVTNDLLITSKKLDDEINQRTNELQHDRNFISQILNTAQVMILTLDAQGKILTLNSFSETLTGLNSSDLESQSFLDLILEANIIIDIVNSLSEFGQDRRSHYQKDCLIKSATGDELYISWFFTLLEEHEGQPEILAVGLDLSDRRKVENQLSWLADHDSLTNLYNRRRFDQELERALSQANRYEKSGAIIFFDIDHFKNINDSSGHQFGDQLLIKVSERLQAITRASDIIARLGGDEFVILAQYISPQQAEELANKICLEMSLLKIRTDNVDLRFTISAGLLVFPVPDAENYSNQDIMASVDIAMYKSKSMGRDRWTLASTTDLERSQIKQRVNWKANIERALDDNRMVLYYQPIMKISDKSITHYECLLRMIGEQGEIIPPGSFIGIAEQTGLMDKIDYRVLDLAFENQAAFIKQGLDIKLSINLSGDFISNPASFEIITTLLDKWQISAHQIIFEITETQAVTNLHSARKLMQNFAKIGGQFALDDFGVGFSSLNYLKHLPVHYLKIDGSFVKGLVENNEDHLFVKAFNSVGHGMGLLTIAEFVEDKKILDVLSTIKVDYAQGYAIAKPAPEPLSKND